MRQKKILSCILIAAMLVGLLAGCGAGKAVPAEPTPVQTQTPSTEAPKLSKNETDESILKTRYSDFKRFEMVKYKGYPVISQFNSNIGVCKNSNKIEKSLEALTVAMTDKVLTDYLLYGIKDVDYNMVDGAIGVGNSRELYFGNSYISSDTKSTKGKQAVINDAIERMNVTKATGVYIDLYEYNESIENINKIVKKYEDLFSGKYDDVEEVLDKLNKELKEAGIDEILAAANNQIEK